MRQAVTVYFDRPGPVNTEAVLEAAAGRIMELGLGHAVVATCTGDTALRAAEAFASLRNLALTAVTLPAGGVQISEKWVARYREYLPAEQMAAKMERRGDFWVYKPITPLRQQELSGRGVKLVRCQFPTALESSASEVYGGCTPALLAHEMVRCLFGRGVYVSMVVANAAADMGAIPVGEEALVIAGTKLGADTAVVLSPGYSTSFYDWKRGTRVVEVVAMPRSR